MSALVVSSVGVKDKDGASVVAGTCTDGTRQLPMIGILLADGTTFFTGAVSLSAATTNGASMAGFISDNSTYQKIVKASAGNLYKLSASNTGTTNVFLRVYDKATNPAPASDTPVLRYLIPPGGREVNIPDVGAAFASGISYVLTTGVADTDVAPVGTNVAFVNAMYK